MPLVLLLLRVSRMACFGERTLGENPARVAWVDGGGAVTPSTFLKVVKVHVCWGRLGRKTYSCASISDVGVYGCQGPS